jgi:hypothetical protein
MMDGWMDGWIDGWMDRWMDGWMDGCGRTDGRMAWIDGNMNGGLYNESVVLSIHRHEMIPETFGNSCFISSMVR